MSAPRGLARWGCARRGCWRVRSRHHLARAQIGDGGGTKTHPGKDGIGIFNQPVRFGAPGPQGQRAPTVGEDTDAVLAGMGLDAAAIADLRARKVVA
ncbi:MAG: hypothetical protein AAGF49_03210 [Pseudomonadota bacterium]